VSEIKKSERSEEKKNYKFVKLFINTTENSKVINLSSGLLNVSSSSSYARAHLISTINPNNNQRTFRLKASKRLSGK
jgi:hypothetical protein